MTTTSTRAVSVLWFGTGSMAASLLPACRHEAVRILAFIDERPSRRGKTYRGLPVIDIPEIPDYTFDYILIGARPYATIAKKLQDLGVPESKLRSLDFASGAMAVRTRGASFTDCFARIWDKEPLFGDIFSLETVLSCDWLQHTAMRFSPQSASSSLAIAVNVQGAIGDSLIDAAWIKELYKALPYPATIDVFGRVDPGFATHLYEFVSATRSHLEFANADGYDVKITIRHIVTVMANLDENKFPEMKPIIAALTAFAERHANYAQTHGFHDNGWARLCMLRGWNRWDELGASGAIPFSRKNRATFSPALDAYAALQTHGLEHRPFITLHLGGEVKDEQTPLQTKNWPVSSWNAFCEAFKARHPDMLLVQLGHEGADGLIDGADVCLAGKTTLHEAAVILKQALLHVDCESGLVHLRRALGGKSVVLFGPTPADFFGYEGNANIVSPACSDCWGLCNDWYTRCPRGLDEPECMAAISPESVAHAVESALAEHAEYSYAMDAVALYSSAGRAAYEPLLEDICQTCGVERLPISRHIAGEGGTLLHASKQWEYPYVISALQAMGTHPLKIADVGSGRGMLSWYLARKGHAVTAYDLNFSHASMGDVDLNRRYVQFAGKQSFRAEFGSMFNLPADDASVDVVTCVSVVEHISWKPYAFKEMLRILKPGGKLVVTYDLVPEGALACGATRQEVFTNSGISALLRAFGITEPVVHTEEAIRASVRDVLDDAVRGLPEDMTVGGFVLTKRLITSL